MRVLRGSRVRLPGSIRRGAAIASLCVAVVFGIAGCGSGDNETSGSGGNEASLSGGNEASASPGNQPSDSESSTRPQSTDRAGGSADARVKPARCPAEAANCSSASGQIVFVEAVDPDGDGDAHFVLLSTDSVTAPGISVIDVRVDLRPEPLPEVGDTISAAGPVFPGSYGQSQIQADELHVRRG